MKSKLAKAVLLAGAAVFVLGGIYLLVRQPAADEDEIAAIAKEIREGTTVEGSMQPEVGEERIQRHIHHMTHQKVKASEKWGAVEMSPENIADLSVIVEENLDAYEHGEYYLEVLDKWQQGDFSNAVEVHNFIWEEQGGTVGRATDLLTPEEEEAFKTKHFD